MEEEPTNIGQFEIAVSELNLSSERMRIVKEGYKSARDNKDLLQARFLSNVWMSKEIEPPQEVQELARNLEKDCEEGKINIKFDTQLEDETTIASDEILFRKIRRCSQQSVKLKSGEGRIFAVVIPSYWKEEEGLPLTLTSINEQRFDDTVIVVVSDNNDEEGRQRFDVGIMAKGDGANVATGSINDNIASARRKGIDRALTSENLSLLPMIIVGTDSDSLLKGNYLQNVREVFKDPAVIATTGTLEYRSDQQEIKTVENKVNKHIRELTNQGFAHLPGANTAIRSDIYRHIGGYCLDYRVGEDGNLAQKVRDYLKYEGNKKGEKVLYVAGQVVSTSAR